MLELLEILARFPKLNELFGSRSPMPNLTIAYVGELLRALRDEGVEFGLADVEENLSVLRARFSANNLHEQADDLFVCDSATHSEAKWTKATTELLALAHFQRIGKLESLGWPPPTPNTSNTPPFDCRVQIGAVAIACDIKPLGGSGFNLVRDTIRPIVERWAEDQGLGAVDISMHYSGTMSQQAVGEALRESGAVSAFETELRNHKVLPPEPLTLSLNGTDVDVTIVPQGGVTSSTGIQPSDALVASVVPTFTKHITQKLKAAVRENVPFLLCAVRPSGVGGGDLKSRNALSEALTTAASSAATLPSGALFLGFIVLDAAANEPSLTCYLRTGAAWPGGISSGTVARELGAALVAIP